MAIAFAATPALSQQVDEFGDPIQGKVVFDYSEYPVVDVGDWRTPQADIEWSIPVIVRDDFDGDYLAVFDKNYQRNIWDNSEIGVVSNWSRNNLRIYAYDSVKTCPQFWCGRRYEIRETDKVAIKIGKEVFRMEGEDGNYPISEELAYALKTAPPGEAKIKISFEGQGNAAKNAIGKYTVSSWKTVYQDAQPVTTEVIAEDSGADQK